MWGKVWPRCRLARKTEIGNKKWQSRKKKEERLQQIANKIVSSVTLLDKVKFYSQQLVLADKLQLTKVVGNIVGDKISKVEKSVSKVADENRKNRLSIYER